jgi:hypothetical protein
MTYLNNNKVEIVHPLKEIRGIQEEFTAKSVSGEITEGEIRS